MTPFRQGPTPWYRLDGGPRWMARGVDRQQVETAMRWAEQREEPAPPPADEPTEFVQHAIQRSYQ